MNTRSGRRILMTADAVGGVWQYALDLSQALAEAGDEVTLALLGPALELEYGGSSPAPGVRLVETGEALDWLADGPTAVERAAHAIAELARREGADLIHCNTPALAGAAAFPAPLVAVAHGCVATWWAAVRTEPLAPSFHWHRDMVRRGLAAADAMVAPSAAYAAHVQRTYHLPAAPLVVHNGRRPLAPGADAGEPLDAALAVGRLWDEAKGTDVLDRAAALMHAPFLAVGAARGPQGQMADIIHLQSQGRLGEADLASLLAGRPVFVSAARFEPFGLAVLEAAQAGCALVLSDITTFRELWDGAALFVPQADAAGFARAADALIADPARREALASAAAARAARFTPAACAAGMAEVYDRLLTGRRAAA